MQLNAGTGSSAGNSAGSMTPEAGQFVGDERDMVL